MTAASLEKPGLVASAVLSGGKLGTTGTDFYIKIMRFQDQTGSPTEETTGDGDTYPHFENSGLIYQQGRMSGGMIASQAIGLANLINTSKNPVVDAVFTIGGTRKETKTIMLKSIARNWDRRGVFVGVTIDYELTDSLPVEAAVS